MESTQTWDLDGCPLQGLSTLELNLNDDYNVKSKISFGCERLDSCFGGGVPVHGITEIAGQAGSGKTQLCLQLALQVQLRGGAAYYLTCGEGPFPARRLRQLASAYQGKYDIATDALLENVITQTAYNTEEQSVLIKESLEKLIPTWNIKLVIIDSLAGLMRTDYTNSKMDNVNKAQLYFELGQKMKMLSFKYHTAFVVVNQVSADFSKPGGSGTRAALGLAWATCVNTRFMLTRKDNLHLDSHGSFDNVFLCENNYQYKSNQQKHSDIDSVTEKENQMNVENRMLNNSSHYFRTTITSNMRRFISLQFAPHLPVRTSEYYIDCNGVHHV
mmetsp:Transcript_10741/g.13949  ORF Transcript_10741/g.13949 Transcript_10741/m.13949 type:complete len:330 (+) Transcript_10741:126-1115(+)